MTKGSARKEQFRIGQVVALRYPDGSWIYAKIYEFVAGADGVAVAARLMHVDGRRQLKDLRPLTKHEAGR